ncbi:hypothetical protein [Bradyrhizobium sp.]|uniref:hypothetical protein n=1 Tax=Bradyrhizobium sp. TaxID=376 RepID=UPI003C53F50E
MRQTISGLVTAFAVTIAGAAPALACGYAACAPCGEAGYVSPCAQSYVPAYTTGCATGCRGFVYERMSDPDTQYYYVNQGPTYTGPGMLAPYPAYREDAVPVWRRSRHDSYHEGYHWHHHYHFIPRQGYYDGHPVLRRYD